MKKLMKPFAPLMLISCLLMGLSTQLFAGDDDRIKQLEDDFKILEQRLILRGPKAEKDRIKAELEREGEEGKIAYTIKFVQTYYRSNERAQNRDGMDELLRIAEKNFQELFGDAGIKQLTHIKSLEQEYSSSPVEAIVYDYPTIINFSARYGYKLVVDDLLDHGADVNARDFLGYTPIHLAKTAEIAALLIEKGADVNAKDFLGYTPLHRARTVEIAALIIEKGADVNARDKYGNTPLYNATNADKASLLIDKGAEVNAKNYLGRSPLHYSRNAEIVLVLIENDPALVNKQDHKGLTPLHVASNVEIAKILIENGADINAQANNGKTPLHVIRNKKVAASLIENKADVNARDNDGNTPIFYTEDPQLFNLLMDNGADIDAVNNNGEGILDYHLNKMGEIKDLSSSMDSKLKLILEFGVDINPNYHFNYRFRSLVTIMKSVLKFVEQNEVNSSVALRMFVLNKDYDKAHDSLFYNRNDQLTLARKEFEELNEQEKKLVLELMTKDRELQLPEALEMLEKYKEQVGAGIYFTIQKLQEIRETFGRFINGLGQDINIYDQERGSSEEKSSGERRDSKTKTGKAAGQ